MKNFCNLSERLKTALEYLKKTDLKSKPDGKYDILKDEIYINIQEYDTKEEQNCKWEAHKRYIDIQYMISGSDSLKDRATDAQPKMPFIGTIIQKQTAHRSKYYVIE